MSKKKLSVLESELTVGSSWEESPLVLWLTQNGLTLLWMLLGIAVTCILLFRFFLGESENIEKQYTQAEVYFSQVIDPSISSDMADESLAKLNALLQQSPELQVKYDGPLAQALILRKDPEKASLYLERALKRTHKDHSPFYADFARTSLLIAQENYEEALSSSQKLQQKIAEIPFDQTLQAINLLRIGSLQQKLGLKNEEHETWNSWLQSFQNWENLQYFQEGKVSLIDYIKARIEETK